MARTAKPAEPTITRDLTPGRATSPHGGGPTRADDADRRTAHTPAGVTRLHPAIRRCHAPGGRVRAAVPARGRGRRRPPGTSSGST